MVGALIEKAKNTMVLEIVEVIGAMDIGGTIMTVMAMIPTEVDGAFGRGISLLLLAILHLASTWLHCMALHSSQHFPFTSLRWFRKRHENMSTRPLGLGFLH